jgi:hypothetical protein
MQSPAANARREFLLRETVVLGRTAVPGVLNPKARLRSTGRNCGAWGHVAESGGNTANSGRPSRRIWNPTANVRREDTYSFYSAERIFLSLVAMPGIPESPVAEHGARLRNMGPRRHTFAAGFSKTTVSRSKNYMLFRGVYLDTKV